MLSSFFKQSALHGIKCIKRPFSAQRVDAWQPWEDDLIRNYVKVNGRRWNDIVQHCLPNRTIQQCQSRWTDVLNPVLKRGPFSMEEKELLEKGVATLGQGKWTSISQQFLPHRSPRRLANEWSNTTKSKMRWTEEEDALLLKGIEQFGPSAWAKIASNLLPWRTRVQIRNHYRSNLDPNVKRAKWSEKELDVLLRRTIIFGQDWKKVAEGIRGRTPEQCSAVWLSELDPALNKGPWSDEETRLFWEKLVECNGQFVKVDLPGRNRLGCFRKFWATVRDDQEFVMLYGDHIKREKTENGPVWRTRVAKLVCEYLKHNTGIRESSNKSIQIHKSGPWQKHELDKLEQVVQDVLTKKGKLDKNDWKIISEQFPGREVQQCKYQYEEHLSTKDLKKGAWTKEEDALLKKLIEEHGVNWDKVHIPNRNKRQCAYRWYRVLKFDDTKKQERLSEEEKSLINEGVNMFGNNWKAIQMTYLPHRTPHQIMRWYNAHGQRKAWTEEEDKALTFAVNKHKNEKNEIPSWAEIAKLVEGRTPQQCKVRWLYSLNPENTKGAWSYDEQMQLFEIVQKYKFKAIKGQNIWPLVAKELGTGRSDWSCRMKFNYMQRKGGNRFGF